MSIDPVSLAITVALNAATMAITASRTIEGPRLQDLSVTVADYGTPLPNFVGQRRIETPVFYAEPITETKRKRKGKSGKYKEFTYSGTFAVIVADHEVEAIIRVWLDRRLAYDSTGATAIEESLDAKDYMRFYLGTETQEPDERMQATIEANEGAGSCPAYLGVSYIFFEDLPLEVFGNRFPTISVEARRDAVDAFPFEEVDPDITNRNLWNTMFTRDNEYLYYVPGGSRLVVYHLPTRTKVTDTTLSVTVDAAMESLGMFDSGNWCAISDLNDLVTYTRQGTLVSRQIDLFPGVSNRQEEAIVRKTGNGQEHVCTTPWSSNTNYFVNGVAYSGGGVRNTCYFEDLDGNVWSGGTGVGIGQTTATFRRIINSNGFRAVVPEVVTVTGLPASTGALNSVHAYAYRNGGQDYFVLSWLVNSIYIINADTGAIVASNTTTILDVLNTPKIFNNQKPGDSSVWVGTGVSTHTEISSADASVLRTINLFDWDTSDSDGNIYSRELDAILCFPQFGGFNIRYLNRTERGDVTLASIANLISESAGLDSFDYDFSALDQIIPGFSWTQGPAKQILDPLFTLYDSLVRPNGFQLEGIKRGGGVNGAAINVENFARTSTDAEDEPYRIEVISESDLPRRIFMTFADLDAEQQPNTAVSQRSTDSVVAIRESSYDLTSLALTASEAQQLVERAIRRPWIGSVKGMNKLAPNYLWILPGDVIDFQLDDDTTIRACIKRKTIAPNRLLSLRWEQDQAAIATLRTTAGAAASGRPTPSVFAPRQTIPFIIDTALVRDADDQSTPFLYLAATPEIPGDWPGADVLTDAEDDGDFETPFFQFTSAQLAIAGLCRDAVPDAVTGVPDYGTQIEVTFYGPTPTIASATLDELIADPTLNLAAVGAPDRWELVQFMTADLQSDGDWLISGLLRGRRGTERFTDDHEAGDSFVLYSSAWARQNMGASKINDTDYYKAITYGLSDSFRTPVEDTFTAEANRPLSVANVQILQDPVSGTFTVTWQRRTRLGGSSINGQDVPLGETSELYNVRVVSGGSTLRSEQVTSEEFYYDTYQQIEDFGFEPASITVEIEQVSPALNLAGATVTATG